MRSIHYHTRPTGRTPMMSDETTDSDRAETYPFYTQRVDGELLTGVLYVANTGRFYEFQNPDNHTKRALFVDPRDGSEIYYANTIDQDVKSAIGGHVRGKVPAEKWAEFREDYMNATAEDFGDWAEFATPSEPLEELALETSR